MKFLGAIVLALLANIVGAKVCPSPNPTPGPDPNPTSCDANPGETKITFFDAIYNDVPNTRRKLCQCDANTVSLVSAGSFVDDIGERLRRNDLAGLVYPEFSCDTESDFRIILNDGTECVASTNNKFVVALLPFCRGFKCETYGFIFNKTADVSLTCGKQVFDIPRQLKGNNKLAFVGTARSSFVGPISGVSCKAKPAAPANCKIIKNPEFTRACPKPKNPLYIRSVLVKHWQTTHTDCICDPSAPASQSDYPSFKTSTPSANQNQGYPYIAALSACPNGQRVCLCNTKTQECWQAGERGNSPELIWLWPFCKGNNCAYNLDLSATNKNAYVQKFGTSSRFTVDQADKLYANTTLGLGYPASYPLVDSVACDCRVALNVNSCTTIQQ